MGLVDFSPTLTLIRVGKISIWVDNILRIARYNKITNILETTCFRHQVRLARKIISEVDCGDSKNVFTGPSAEN